MSPNNFPILIITGRPAAGKSEVIDFLKKCPALERLQRFHIADFEELELPSAQAVIARSHLPRVA